jgi:membrane-associated protease RseP (regulator of RpoE activity)
MKPGETPKPTDTNIQGKKSPLNAGITAQTPSTPPDLAGLHKGPLPDREGADENQPIGPWLSRNLTWLLLGAALLGVLTYVLGVEKIWIGFVLVLGLSLMIFVHELGHFVVAKLCDVHVQTFSIGFGPALPGCSFRWGETLYKLALFPLGGYVKMVGEGTESEEGDDDPRSFKNKSVGQRMAIISAGVIMNVLMACVCFIIAYESGVERLAAVIGSTDAGSPAWHSGVRSGSVVKEIGARDNPVYEDLMTQVVLSGDDQRVRFVFQQPAGKPYELAIKPRRDENDTRPVIGVTSASTTKLPPKKLRTVRARPVTENSPGAAARELNLNPNDAVVATTDPDRPDEMLELAKPVDAHLTSDYAELGRRMLRLSGEPMKVRVLRGDKEEVLDLPPEGLQFDDEIVGTTDDHAGGGNPFHVSDLPRDTFRDPDNQGYDFFEYRRRMKHLAGNPVVLKVRRPGDANEHLVFVPQSFHYNLAGVRMGMGLVTAVRDGSAGDKAGVQEKKDTILQIELVDKETKERVRFVNGSDKDADKEARTIDPVRLPAELRHWASGRKSVEARLTVGRTKERDEGGRESLPAVDWDFSWEDDDETPLNIASPMPIPELGIAYQVQTTVEHVADKCAARQAGLEKDDVILEIWVQEFAKPGADPEWIKKPLKLWKDQEADASGDKRKPEAWWANVTRYFQLVDQKKVKVLLKRQKEPIELELEPDPLWPTDDLGINFMPQRRLQKASGFGEAVVMGLRETYEKIYQVYLSMRSVVTGRVPFLENAQGPIGIAVIGYNVAGQDFNAFLLFLGLININLAVVNFLPIPVLDGGHMVFLIYEKIRGKPASEQVRTYTTFAGLALIASLMLLVIFLDFKHYVF